MTVNRDAVTLVTAIVGALLGAVGAALGVLNTWRAFDRDRLRVRVTPIWLFDGRGSQCMALEVINLGYLPVTITNVGFTARNGHLPVFDGLIDSTRLPQRMEPRTKIIALVKSSTYEDKNFAKVSRGYADTACGRRFTGSSSALRGQKAEVRRELAKLQDEGATDLP